MKKEYIEPSIDVIQFETDNVLETSKAFGGNVAGEEEELFPFSGK